MCVPQDRILYIWFYRPLPNENKGKSDWKLKNKNFCKKNRFNTEFGYEQVKLSTT